MKQIIRNVSLHGSSVSYSAVRRTGLTFRTASSAFTRRQMRSYATYHDIGRTEQASKRRHVTVVNDDGRIPWKALSLREKAARTTQQSVNVAFILLGAAMTAGISILLYQHVLSPQSETSHFERASNRVRSDPRCIELLGDGKKISAFGEGTWNRWAMSRPIASTVSKDANGVEHLLMHFNVKGPLNSGIVRLHMIRKPTQREFEYRYLYLDVKGHTRVYLENAEEKLGPMRKHAGKLFGIQWR